MGFLQELWNMIRGGPHPAPKPSPVPEPFPPPAPAPMPPGPPQGLPTADEILRAHNDVRKAHGLPTLAFRLSLQNMAEAHAKVEAAAGIQSHDGLPDGTYDHRIKKSGYMYVNAGENVAETPSGMSATHMVAYWMRSAGHRANILGPFLEFGGAVAASQSGFLYWCTEFGRPASASRVAGLRPPLFKGEDFPTGFETGTPTIEP